MSRQNDFRDFAYSIQCQFKTSHRAEARLLPNPMICIHFWQFTALVIFICEREELQLKFICILPFVRIIEKQFKRHLMGVMWTLTSKIFAFCTDHS